MEKLAGIVSKTVARGGKILIPSFAVERTQEIICLLSKAWHEYKIPKDLPIYVDSPLAIAASEVYVKHPQLFDKETLDLIAKGLSPLTMTNLHITKSMEESQKLNLNPEPAIILAGSGMANAGRILHHFKHNLWRPNCHVIFVGFQAQGTTGRRLVEGADIVKIFREPVSVRAKIHTIGGFSGHADQQELVNWLKPQIHDNLAVNLIHGEEASTLAFESLLNQTFPSLKTNVPYWREIIELKTETIENFLPEISQAISSSQNEFSETLSLKNRFNRFNDYLTNNTVTLPPETMANLENLLNQVEEIFLAVKQ
jgi:metallo-beta-lactamase family protein